MIESSDVIRALELFENGEIIRNEQFPGLIDCLTTRYLKSHGLITATSSGLTPGGGLCDFWCLSEKGRRALTEYREHQQRLLDAQESMRLAKESLVDSQRSTRIAEKSLAASEESNRIAKESLTASKESNRIARKSLESSEKSAASAEESNRIAKESLASAKKSLEATEKNIAAAEESNRIARKSNRIAIASALGTVGSFVLACISIFIAMTSH